MCKKLLNIQVCIVVLVTFSISGCISFDKIGKDLTRGIKGDADSIGYNLANGLVNRLTNVQSQQQLKEVLDSVISVAGLSANKQVIALRDSLVKNDATRVWLKQLVETLAGVDTRMKIAALRDEALGNTTKARIAAIRNELLGYETDYRIQQILNNAVASVLNDSTNRRLGTMVDTVLGPRTNSLVKALIDTAMLNIAYRLRENVNPSLQDNASFIRKYATQLLITVGVIAAVIVLLVWRSRQKYLKAVTLLTSQIQGIPNQEVYDDLTMRIKDNAVKAGVEPTIREVLDKNGLLGRENWENLQRKQKKYAGNGVQ